MKQYRLSFVERNFAHHTCYKKAILKTAKLYTILVLVAITAVLLYLAINAQMSRAEESINNNNKQVDLYLKAKDDKIANLELALSECLNREMLVTKDHTVIDCSAVKTLDVEKSRKIMADVHVREEALGIKYWKE